MNKGRLEGLSDAVFAIVMTLLTIEIILPPELHISSDSELWHAVLETGPLLLAYFTSFLVLAMFWLLHNFFFHSLTKTVNRVLIMLNMVYLSFVALIPFSAAILGAHIHSVLAVRLYGLNVLLIGLVSVLLLRYAIYSDEVELHELDSRRTKQSRIRLYITPISTLVGIAVSGVSIPLALFFYAFPVLFNILPGTLNAIERVFKFELR